MFIKAIRSVITKELYQQNLKRVLEYEHIIREGGAASTTLYGEVEGWGQSQDKHGVCFPGRAKTNTCFSDTLKKN